MANLLTAVMEDPSLISEFRVATAKAAVLFKIYSRKAHVAAVIKQHLRAMFLVRFRAHS